MNIISYILSSIVCLCARKDSTIVRFSFSVLFDRRNHVNFYLHGVFHTLF